MKENFQSMLKQTVLKFQGALGLLGFGAKGNDEDGDSGNSFTQASWEEENDDDKDSYLSTCVLIPTHQRVSEIFVKPKTPFQTQIRVLINI